MAVSRVVLHNDGVPCCAKSIEPALDGVNEAVQVETMKVDRDRNIG